MTTAAADIDRAGARDHNSAAADHTFGRGLRRSDFVEQQRTSVDYLTSYGAWQWFQTFSQAARN
jgi:hypothetical protein